MGDGFSVDEIYQRLEDAIKANALLHSEIECLKSSYEKLAKAYADNLVSYDELAAQFYPRIDFSSEVCSDMMRGEKTFMWKMEPVGWFVRVPNHERSLRMVRAFKRRAYRDVVKRVRESFLSAWEQIP